MPLRFYRRFNVPDKLTVKRVEIAVAQGLERAYIVYRVDASVLQWYRFSRSFDQFNRAQIRRQLSTCHREQFWRGIEVDEVFYTARVKRQIEPRPDADFSAPAF